MIARPLQHQLEGLVSVSSAPIAHRSPPREGLRCHADFSLKPKEQPASRRCETCCTWDMKDVPMYELLLRNANVSQKIMFTIDPIDTLWYLVPWENFVGYLRFSNTTMAVKVWSLAGSPTSCRVAPAISTPSSLLSFESSSAAGKSCKMMKRREA